MSRSFVQTLAVPFVLMLLLSACNTPPDPTTAPRLFQPVLIKRYCSGRRWR